jgi:hypothetical protein
LVLSGADAVENAVKCAMCCGCEVNEARIVELRHEVVEVFWHLDFLPSAGGALVGIGDLTTLQRIGDRLNRAGSSPGRSIPGA